MASPFERSAMDAYPSKPAWDAEATEILGAMLERWRLTDATVFPATFAAVVASVRRADGAPAVLKIGFPHEEGIWEAVVLDALPHGLGPALLDEDPWTWAMLLERLDPGTSLAEAGLPAEEATELGSGMLRRFSAVAVDGWGLPALEDQYRPFVDRFAADAPRSFADAGVPENLIGEAAGEFDALCRTSPAPVLLHGDFNTTNLLRHGDGWRVIDPKPVVGDLAFDLFSLLREVLDEPASPERLAGLAERASTVAGADAERTLRWMRMRGILSAYWNLEDGLRANALRDVATAGLAADLLGD